MIVKVVSFCRKGLRNLLKPATRRRLIEEQHGTVERASDLVLWLAAKVLLRKQDLPNFATGKQRQTTRLMAIRSDELYDASVKQHNFAGRLA